MLFADLFEVSAEDVHTVSLRQRRDSVCCLDLKGSADAVFVQLPVARRPHMRHSQRTLARFGQRKCELGAFVLAAGTDVILHC